jgi:6-phosphogluconolactonase (cycloisomerase 2 family)
VGNAAVANVAVSCQTNAPSTFTIGGSLTGLGTGSSLVLQNRGGSNLTLNTNGSFTFANAATTGTPYAVTVLTQPAGATCAVSNGTGSVAGANVTSPAVVCTPNPAFSVGGNVNNLAVGGALVLLNNGSDETTVFANGSFVFGSAVNSGLPYAVTVKVQPAGQQCTVSNGTGPVTNANIASVAIHCVSDFQYAFTTNANGSTGTGGTLNFAPGSVSAYAIQRTTGAVGKLGADLSSGGLGVSSVAVHPSGTLAAVSNRGSNTTPGNVVMFIVNVGTGAVTKVGTYSAGESPKSVAFSKNGAHLLVANEGSGNVSVFDVQTTGALTEVANSPFATGGPNPNFLTLTPSGNHALISNFGTNSVSVMSFDPASGALAGVAGSPYTTGSGPVDIAVTPDGGLVYVINHTTTTGTVTVFAMDSAGRLTARPSQTPSTGPYGMAITPNGQYAYIAEFGGSGSVLAFRINATSGALTPLANGTYSTVGLNYSIAINKAGSMVLVTNWGDPGLPVPTNKVTAFAANATTGALTPVAGSPLPTGLFPEIVAIGP